MLCVPAPVTLELNPWMEVGVGVGRPMASGMRSVPVVILHRDPEDPVTSSFFRVDYDFVQ